MRVRYDDLDYPGDDGLYYFGDEPFTGVSVSYHDGRVTAESEFRDGMVWGVSHSWHPSGAPESERQSVAGVLHGLCQEWDEQGRQTLYEVFELGVCVWRRRWEAGRLTEDWRLTESDSDFAVLQMLRTHLMRGLAESGRVQTVPGRHGDSGGAA